MDGLRQRDRKVFTGFTSGEVEKMEKLLREYGEESMDIPFCKKLTRNFNCSKGRAGKPALKWTEVKSWFQNSHLGSPYKDHTVNDSNKLQLETLPLDKPNGSTTTSNETDWGKVEGESNGMDRLRQRQRKVFSGFTSAEVEKMEKLLKESGKETMDIAFCKKVARRFNCSKGRAGKPALKWIEVQSWFQNSQLGLSSNDHIVDGSNKSNSDTLLQHKSIESTPTLEVGREPEPSKLEFEARSSKDGAWYDVDKFRTCRNNSSGNMEALVKFIGFGSDEDEWVNVKESVRERSLGLEHSECHTLKVGDQVLCFQERKDVAKYYDAHIIDIKRRLHDIRGCRCTFLIRYNHNDVEEKIGLSRLCRILKPQTDITEALPEEASF